jgi:hypothetical protein
VGGGAKNPKHGVARCLPESGWAYQGCELAGLDFSRDPIAAHGPVRVSQLVERLWRCLAGVDQGGCEVDADDPMLRTVGQEYSIRQCRINAVGRQLCIAGLLLQLPERLLPQLGIDLGLRRVERENELLPRGAYLRVEFVEHSQNRTPVPLESPRLLRPIELAEFCGQNSLKDWRCGDGADELWGIGR